MGLRKRSYLSEAGQMQSKWIWAFNKRTSPDVEFGFLPGYSKDEAFRVQIGLGGEWWNDTVKLGKNVIHHRKEKVDDAYAPVVVNVSAKTMPGDVRKVVFNIKGGFLGNQTASFTAKSSKKWEVIGG